jgi:CRP-like cAMP-binding protein
MTRLSPRETEAVAARAAEILGLSRADAAEMLEAPPEMVARLSAWEDEQVAREQSWAGDDPATRERSPAGDEPATPERSSIGGDE